MAEVKHAAGIIGGVAFPELTGITVLFPDAPAMDNVNITIVIDDITVDTSSRVYTSGGHLEITGIANGEILKNVFDDVSIEWHNPLG